MSGIAANGRPKPYKMKKRPDLQYSGQIGKGKRKSMDGTTMSMETTIQPGGAVGNGKKKKGLTGSTLKLIAIGAMFIDHFGAIVLEHYLMQHMDELTEMVSTGQGGKLMAIYMIDMVLRLIGRLGFPIFCFLLIEGFNYTRSRAKYAVRLGLFALISEVPFDLGFNNQILEFTYQNVFFTLFIGLLTIWGIDALRKKTDEKLKGTGGAVLQFLGIAVITAVGMVAAELLRTDYAAIGVGTIVVMYLSKKNYKAWLGILCAVAIACMANSYGLSWEAWIFGGVLLLVLLIIFLTAAKRSGNGRALAAGCCILTVAMPMEVTSFATAPLAAAYNGQRGLKLKYVFYLFYPLHILFWYFVCVCLGIY